MANAMRWQPFIAGAERCRFTQSFDLLRDAKRIINLDAQIAHGASSFE
jgi:hypothetical protein